MCVLENHVQFAKEDSCVVRPLCDSLINALIKSDISVSDSYNNNNNNFIYIAPF